MSTDTRRDATSALSPRAGSITLALAIVFVAATAFTYLLSLSDGFNPPDWVRALGLLGLPIGFFGTPVAYAVARSGPGRGRGRVGLGVALVGLVAFVVLQLVAG
jgi:hypothetical protein